MSKGKRRLRQEAKSHERKVSTAGKPSKYSLKHAKQIDSGNFGEASPFHFDVKNPEHETVEQARERASRERGSRGRSS